MCGNEGKKQRSSAEVKKLRNKKSPFNQARLFLLKAWEAFDGLKRLSLILDVLSSIVSIVFSLFIEPP